MDTYKYRKPKNGKKLLYKSSTEVLTAVVVIVMCSQWVIPLNGIPSHTTSRLPERRPPELSLPSLSKLGWPQYPKGRVLFVHLETLDRGC